MKIDIYTSSNNGTKFLSVLKGTKIEEVELPADIDTDLLTLSPFRTRLVLDADKAHSALDQANIIAQLEEKGYATHGAKFEITLTAGK